MKVEHLDHIITEMILARLERPDFLALADERDGSTDDEHRELLTQIEADREYLESVKAQAAEPRQLSPYLDQQTLVQPRTTRRSGSWSASPR